MQELLDGLSDFVQREVLPRHRDNGDILAEPRRRYTENGHASAEVRKLAREIRMASAEAGYYQMFVPESLGGGGLGWRALYDAWERLHHLCGMDYWLGYQTIAHWASGPSLVLDFLRPSAKERYLPGLMTGEDTICFAMSEPDAGTDIWNMRTTASDCDGGWRITGTKQWTSNGAEADHAVVFAVTDQVALRERTGGISAFIIPTDTPGFRVDSVIKLFGHAGGHEAILSLDEVVVTPDQLLGELHAGLTVGLQGTNIGRLFNSAKSVGLARWALEKAVAHAKLRTTFGKPLIEHQAIAFSLADAAMDVRAAHLLGIDCAERIDAGEPHRKEAAMAKGYSTEMACRVIDTAMQVHGGMGLTSELALAEAWQEVRVIRIADGSAEMMRRAIAKQLAAGDLAL